MKKTKPRKIIPPVPLFSHWTRVAGRIRRAKRVALLLDFDGTLVTFKRDPKEVHLEAATRRVLERLARRPRVVLAFISGRRRADLRRRVGVSGALYFGLHGFERGPRVRVSAASRRGLRRALDLVTAAILDLPGVWAEDKHGCVVVHYRGVPGPAAAKARAAVRRAVKEEAIEILPGKKMLELLAPEIKGKGEAAAALVRASGRGVLPVFFGDTETDEMAFESLRGAITVKVGNGRNTRAHYTVRNPEDVRMFLERLEDVLARDHKPHEPPH
ncbi:MAG: trehalose-phosphatase [Terriglobia bacterium]